MENAHRQLTPLDELYLQRSYELAARGIGNTSPNPPVGAVLVRDGHIVGEGYHHRAGSAHAETNALAQAGSNGRGATVYVSLEPCRHVGATPPCTQALIEAGVARVVAGTLDPTNTAAAHRSFVRAVSTSPSPRIRLHATSSRSSRARAPANVPYAALKMAMSLDGAVASRSGVRERLGSEAEERYVRELRTAYDAVMVGAGTVRVDDPQLTVRPPHDRVRPYTRVVACGSGGISPRSRIFAAEPGIRKRSCSCRPVCATVRRAARGGRRPRGWGAR